MVVLGGASVAALMLASSPASTSLLAVEVPGAQPSDIFYIAGVIGVFAFGARQVFDSAFPENEEYVPPMAGTLPGPLKNLPFIGGESADPAEKAERLRQQLQAAAQAGDLKTAYKLEKELKNVMAESGIRFIVDDEFQQSEDTEQLPDNW